MNVHPIKTFKLRYHIASRSLLQLVIFYCCLCALLSFVLSVIFFFAFESTHTLGDLVFIFWLEIFGKEPDWGIKSNSVYIFGKLTLSVFSLLLPALFLGSIVYKVFIFQKQSLVFRDRCEITTHNGKHFISAGFYVSSALSLHNLSFNVFLRTYESTKECGEGGLYPMNTYSVNIDPDMHFPLPYNFVPSILKIPVVIQKSDKPVQDKVISLSETSDGFNFVGFGTNIHIRPENGDFCELFIVCNAELPALQSTLREIKKYKLPDDLAKQGLPCLKTRFDRDRDKFIVENWDDF